jgi:hypothetical protein
MTPARRRSPAQQPGRAQRRGGFGGLPRLRYNTAHTHTHVCRTLALFVAACGARCARLRKGTANRSNHSATEARSRRTLRYERLRAATATIKRCARALAPFVAACVARTRERERTKASWERTQQARRRQLRRWSQVPTKASADAAAQSDVLKGARALLQELLSDFKGSTSRRASARAAAKKLRPST